MSQVAVFTQGSYLKELGPSPLQDLYGLQIFQANLENL